jgi:hypothetical protein
MTGPATAHIVIVTGDADADQASERWDGSSSGLGM